MTTTVLFQTSMDALQGLRAEPAPERITNDEHGIVIAMAVALRADCTRRRVGAVIVDVSGRVVGTGRNGAPPGRPGCLSAGACPRGRMSTTEVKPGFADYSNGKGTCIALHAEVNAVLYSASPQARTGGTIYVTDGPCDDCYKVLAGSGLARVVWPETTDHGWVLESRSLTEGPIGGLYD